MANATFIGFEHAESAIDGSSTTVNVPAGTQNGDLMFLIHWCYIAPQTANPGGWTAMGGNNGWRMWRRTASSEPASYTLTSPSPANSVAMATCIAVWRDWPANTGTSATNAAFVPALAPYSVPSGNYFSLSTSPPTVYFTRMPYLAMAANRHDASLTPANLDLMSGWDQRGTATIIGASAILGSNQAFRVRYASLDGWHIPGLVPWCVAETEPTAASTGTYNTSFLGAIVNGPSLTEGAIDPAPAPLTVGGRIKVKERMKFEHLPYDLHRGMTRELR